MTGRSNTEQYASFKAKQERLANLLKTSSEVIAELQMNKFQENLSRLSEKVHNDAFKIQVVGTFKNGKSTFINSFLGEEVLPAYALPCTAVINEVKYGKEKKAVLYFRNPLPEVLPAEIPDEARAHMEKHNMKDIPPMEIPYDEIEDYVVIPIGKDPKEMLLESPYEKVELFWPLELLKNGVEIIDSPGLNEHATRTKVTTDYLSRADAILFVLNAEALCSQEEMRFIENDLKGQEFEETFFVVNRFDLIRERERPRLQQFAKMKLMDYTTLGDSAFFFVSARDALDGKLDGDTELLARSGMGPFEKRLSEFLVKQKGKAKLSQPAKELKRILNQEALFNIIPQQRKMLSSSLDELRERYSAVQPQLNALRLKKTQLHSQLMLRIERLKPVFTRVFAASQTNLIESIPVWIEEYEPTVKLGMVPTKERTTAVVVDITEHISTKVDEQQKEWRKKVLTPVIEEKTVEVFEAVETNLTELFKDIDSVQLQMSGGDTEAIKRAPVWQRVLGVVGGMAIGDYGLVASAGIHGLGKEFALTLAFEFGAGLVLGFLGIFNPFTACAVLASSIFMNFKTGESRGLKKIKEAVSENMVNKVAEMSEENNEKVIESIQKKFIEMAEQIVGAVEAEINETENQVQRIIEAMEQGRENVALRNSRLGECENEIKELSGKLDQLIFELLE